MAGKVNIIQAAAPQCPTKESCRACHNERCWSSFACQKTNEYFNNLTTGKRAHTAHHFSLGQLGQSAKYFRLKA